MQMTPKEKNEMEMASIAKKHGVKLRDVMARKIGCRCPKRRAARIDIASHFHSKGLSLPHIGRIMQRHHTTVLHSLRLTKTGA